MPQNGIQHEGITALAEAFKSNPNLKVCSTASQIIFTLSGFILARFIVMLSDISMAL